MVAPSPCTSRDAPTLRASLKDRSLMSIVAVFASAKAFASYIRDPMANLTGYVLPRSRCHLAEIEFEQKRVFRECKTRVNAVSGTAHHAIFEFVPFVCRRN